MDWGRAKNVLILAFLMLNVLLGYQLWSEWRDQGSSSVDWTSLPPDTQQIMQEKNIRVEGKIPTETPEMRILTFTLKKQPSKSDKAAEKTAIEPQPESRIVFYRKELESALGGTIPDLKHYEYDQGWGNREGVFVLNRMVDGYPMFDIRLELYNSDQRIMAYRQDTIQTLSSEGSKDQQVLPAAQAVARLIDYNLQAGSVIKDIRLGYHGQLFDTISAPSWRVLLESGEVYYVHAISGDVSTDKGTTLTSANSNTE
ncbi:two-component system regulatory protein YycI [Cohnella faecalis]|uniref:Regulatory protein YycH-like domain-containing protein n=1 Tax=Cohnella faecalis TaxID=2315694 RepID=A0A398CJX1_9BACL|nr:two-component system regulatory protein YycI [Cohnella faecalis]RIE01479.1 hypothetical protein D3H35_24300 [Cohnella faecalis]